MSRKWQIGELARQSKVSVRTLRHYEAIGLLCPASRGENGYRLYEASDVVRLGQIKSLQQVGFSLEQIRAYLQQQDVSPSAVLKLHLKRVEEQLERAQTLRERLQNALAHLEERGDASPDEFLKIIEAVTLMEKYYTPEQLAFLEERKNTVGQERIRQIEAEWPHLMDDVRGAIERGVEPSSEEGRELARRWNGLVEEFTGGNAGVRQSLGNLYENESQVAGMDVKAMQPLFDFIRDAQSQGVDEIAPDKTNHATE